METRNKDIADFKNYLAGKGLSMATQNAYAFSASGFLGWCGYEPLSMAKKDVLKYLEFLKTSKVQKNNTRQYVLYGIGHYYNYLIEQGLTSTNPTALLKLRGTNGRKLHKTFTLVQVDELHEAYHQHYLKEFNEEAIPRNTRVQSRLSRERNYVMLGFLIYQGLVSREFNRLMLDDLDFTKATVKIHGRSGERNLPLIASQIGALMHYIHAIRPQFIEYCQDDDRLFFALPASGSKTTQSTNLTEATRHLNRQLRTLNPSYTNLRQLRASRIVYWLKTEGLRRAQYLAGHKSIVSTEEYLPEEIEQLSGDIQKFNPF